MSEKPIQHRIKAHKENTIYSAYLVRILNNLAPSFSPRAEPSDAKGQSEPHSKRGAHIRVCTAGANGGGERYVFIKLCLDARFGGDHTCRAGEASPAKPGKHMQLAHVWMREFIH